MYEYWIGENIDYDKIWDAYEQGEAYVQKYHSMRVHLFRLKLREHPQNLPLFNFEAVYKTIKGYFHDLKKFCLSSEGYATAGPLFVYGVNRGSGVWDFLGELRQLIMLGTTLADEKAIGQKLENMDKRIEILKKHFGGVISAEDFKQFMKAQAPWQLEKAFQKLIDQGIEKIEISKKPFQGDFKETERTLTDIKGLLEEADE
jgi:hypothetical protein